MEGGVLAAGALFLMQIAALAVLPFAPLVLAARMINGLQDARIAWTPYVELAALCTGIAAGGVVLDYNLDPASLGAEAIFQAGGPWDQTAREFLLTRANPSAYSLAPLLPWPFSSGTQTTAGLSVYILSGLIIYAPIVVFRSRQAFANAARNAFIVLWGAYASVYGFCFALWLLNKLNFWVFALLLMFFLAVGSRSEQVTVKLR